MHSEAKCVHKLAKYHKTQIHKDEVCLFVETLKKTTFYFNLHANNGESK